MKVYRELKLSGSKEALQEVVQRMEARATGEWKRDSKAEKEIMGPSDMYCFVCAASQGRHSASVWLTGRDTGVLRVANVVPKDVRRLEYDEYNRVVEDFNEQIALPASEGLATVTLGSNMITLDNWLSGNAIEKLTYFSDVANRSTGSSHPMDRQRWLAFVITAHLEQSPLTAHDLERWLHEEAKWPEERASELAAEYDDAREVLKAYDAARH